MKRTLNEVINEVGLTRRQIQECENYGSENDRDRSANHLRNKHHKPFTIQPTKENGKLMYDEDAVERLWLIKFYKELDYKHDDISKVFNDPDYDKEKSLDKAIEQLEEKKNRLDSLIVMAKYYRMGGRTMCNDSPFSMFSFEQLLSTLNFAKDALLYEKLFQQMDEFKDNFEITDDFSISINECYKKRIPVKDEKVLQCMFELYKANEKASKQSVTYFCICFLMAISIESRFSENSSNKEIDLKKADDFVIYIENSIIAFFLNYKPIEIKIFNIVFDNYLNEIQCSDKQNIECMQLLNRILKEQYEIENFNIITDSFSKILSTLIIKFPDKCLAGFLGFLNYMEEINKIS